MAGLCGICGPGALAARHRVGESRTGGSRKLRCGVAGDAERPATPWRLLCRERCRTFSGMAMLRAAPRLVAVLGPTNTGKTHLAIERMLGHRSGMIGFPLRLLAREN